MYSLYGQIIDHLKANGKHDIKAIEQMAKRVLRMRWTIGFKDRGMGHGDYAVMTKKYGFIVVECPDMDIAEHICNLHNAAIKVKPFKTPA